MGYDWSHPLETAHPEAQGLEAWWQCIPTLAGGTRWFDLRGGIPLETVSTRPTFRPTFRAGGFAELGLSASPLECSVSRVTQPSGALTVGCWFYRVSGVSGTRVLLEMLDGAAPSYRLRSNSPGGTLFAQGTNGGATYALTGGSVADDAWHHVALTVDGSTARLYVDGVLAGSGSASAPSYTSSPLTLGDSGTIAGAEWSGAVDDLRIYSRPLSADEIGGWFRGGRGRVPRLLRSRPVVIAQGGHLADRVPLAITAQTPTVVKLAGSAPATPSLTARAPTAAHSGNGPVGSIVAAGVQPQVVPTGAAFAAPITIAGRPPTARKPIESPTAVVTTNGQSPRLIRFRNAPLATTSLAARVPAAVHIVDAVDAELVLASALPHLAAAGTPPIAALTATGSPPSAAKRITPTAKDLAAAIVAPRIVRSKSAPATGLTCAPIPPALSHRAIAPAAAAIIAGGRAITTTSVSAPRSTFEITGRPVVGRTRATTQVAILTGGVPPLRGVRIHPAPPVPAMRAFGRSPIARSLAIASEASIVVNVIVAGARRNAAASFAVLTASPLTITGRHAADPVPAAITLEPRGAAGLRAAAAPFAPALVAGRPILARRRGTAPHAAIVAAGQTPPDEPSSVAMLPEREMVAIRPARHDTIPQTFLPARHLVAHLPPRLSPGTES